MKVNIYSAEGEAISEVELPSVFDSELREDLIKRAFRSISLSLRQPYGSYPHAGMRRVGHNIGPGHGIARLPRIEGGSRAVLLASFRGGKSAHSPRTDKILLKRINKKERTKARNSALSMTKERDLVIQRGHKVPENVTLPVIVDDKIESFRKTRDAVTFLQKVGLYGDVERAISGQKIRAGRGKARNRKYRVPRSILFVGSNQESLRPFSGITGVEIATVRSLSLRKLAPGGKGGRLTVFTKSALEQLREVNE